MSLRTYEEIGNKLGITKQAVCQNTKKAINKVYNYIEKNCAENPLDAIIILTTFLNINNHDDFKQMYKTINKNTKKRIELSSEWINKQS